MHTTITKEFADSWALVELHRWQYGELPQPNDTRPLVISIGLQNMANALEAGMKKDATPEVRQAMPDPFNVCAVLRYTAKTLEEVTTAETAAAPIRKSLRLQPKQCGRNDTCPCGSNKKYKKCCLRSSKASAPQENVCPHCYGQGGRYTGDPCHHTEGWEPCPHCS